MMFLLNNSKLHHCCQGAAEVSYCSRQASHSRAWPAEPRPWSASAKQTLRDAEFAPEGQQVVVHRASTATLARQPREATREICVYRTW